MKSSIDLKLSPENINKYLESTLFNQDKDIDEIVQKLKYVDVCYYAIKFITEKLSSPTTMALDFYQKVFNIATNVLDGDSDNKYFYKENKKNKKMKLENVINMHIKMWLKFLKAPMPEQLRLDVMITIGDEILDNVDDSSVFSDIVIKSFEKSNESGIVTLRAIFKLLLHGKIHYSPLYDVLYDLLTEDIFKSPYCGRFFDDLSSILSSKTMPHAIATKFAKRLSQMTELTTATHHLPMLVRLIVNLMKWHSGATCLIHRKISDENNSEEMLLEIKSLQNHFDSEVRNLAMAINSKLNNQIDNLVPTKSIEAKEKKIIKCHDRIKEAINSLMKNNCSLPELEPISNFGTVSMKLF